MKLSPFAMPLLALSVLASCGASKSSDGMAIGGNGVENATVSKFALTSDTFQQGQAIPVRFTCEGEDRSPPLRWGEPPAGTRSLVLIVDDPDAPNGLFRHWGAFNIPAAARELAEGTSAPAEAQNDFGKPGYGGPCPPQGHGPHRYHFKLYALDADALGLPTGIGIKELEAEARKHAIGQAELVGTFERK